MNLKSRLPLPFFGYFLFVSPASASVQDWFFAKGPVYRQNSDHIQPTQVSAWAVEIAVETTTAGDANSVGISLIGSAVVHPLTYDDGEWLIEKEYESKAAMDAEFPSNNSYTITLQGGSLGLKVQTFAVGADNYPDAPFLVGPDYTRAQSIDSAADFRLHWSEAGNIANSAELEITERQSEQEVAWFEYDGNPLPEEQLLPTNLLSPGYCYSGYLSIQETTEASGAGGFGVTGYIDHTSSLTFDLQTVLSPSVDAIVGAWQFGDGAADDSGVLVFQANGVYFHAEDIPNGAGSDTDGMERGTYTWNENSGVLVASPQVDTNGTIGLSHPNGTDIAVINGDTMSLTDNDETTVLKRVGFDPSVRIEGGWRICDNVDSNTGVLVFLDNGIYFHAQVGNGNSGMERGTYSWNSGTGTLAATPIVDTNNDIGLSHPTNGMYAAHFATPRVMELFDGERFYLHRVTNAAVMPDWRLNKARNYNQTADNTAPSTAVFWDVFGDVETRNPSDAMSVTLSGGGLSNPVSYSLDEEPGEWFYEKDYTTEALLDAEFPDNQVYTVTISGGELGTVSQEINIGAKSFPNIPFLVDTGFSDLQSFDPTDDFELDWNTPANATSVSLVVTSLPNENGMEFFDGNNLGVVSGSTIPARSVPAGFQAYGYLEFSNFLLSFDGAGGFGSSGFSGRHSIILDFPVNAKNGTQLVSSAAEDAGLSGQDTAPDASPFDDGVPNILKYAFNMNLGGPDPGSLESGSGNSGLPVFGVGSSSSASAHAADFQSNANILSSEFKVEFIRRKGSGLTYTPKVSSTLQPGSFTEMTGTETVSPIGTDGKFERVIVRQPYDPAVTPKAFGIVEVSGM